MKVGSPGLTHRSTTIGYRFPSDGLLVPLVGRLDQQFPEQPRLPRQKNRGKYRLLRDTSGREAPDTSSNVHYPSRASPGPLRPRSLRSTIPKSWMRITNRIYITGIPMTRRLISASPTQIRAIMNSYPTTTNVHLPGQSQLCAQPRLGRHHDLGKSPRIMSGVQPGPLMQALKQALSTPGLIESPKKQQ